MPLIQEAVEEDKEDLQKSVEFADRTVSALNEASALSQAKITNQLVDQNIEEDEVAKRVNANSVAGAAEISGFMQYNESK